MPRQIGFRSGSLSLNQHLQSPPHVRSVDAILSFPLRRFKLQEATFLFVIGNVVRKVCRTPGSAPRLLENAQTVARALLDAMGCLAKASVSFAGKADDDVAGQRQPATRTLDAFDPLPVIVACVTAPHQFQNAITA